MYKLLIVIFATLFSGCSFDRPKVGYCYFNDTYSVAIKVTSVLEYGAFFEVVQRPPSMRMEVPKDGKKEVYLDFEAVNRQYRMYRVDCEAYEKVSK